MDLPFFTHVTALAALAVVAITEILKLKFVPVSFANRYPVPTNIILSIIAAVIAVTQSDQPHPQSWPDWVGLVATISVVAATAYNQLLKNWSELRATEGEK